MLWFQGAGSGLTEPDPATARCPAKARRRDAGDRCDARRRVPGSNAAPPGRLGQDGAMAPDTDRYRLYSDLAAWWPLISPPEEYTEEAAFAARLLGRAARPVQDVLELGSGGGHSASHLRPRFTMTLVDASSGMLAVSRELNPGCTHVEGDMRTIR